MKVKLRTNAARIAREISEFPAHMSDAVAAAMDLQNQLTIGYTVKNKLTAANPPYLNVRTGRLRGSLRASRAIVRGKRITSDIGTNVAYAGVHEYGFKGTVQVKAFERQIPPGRFGRNSAGGGTERVRAHSRRVKFKARHMIHDGVEDTLQDYADKISAAIEEAWNQ
jgi:phage gpG-like protein